MTSATGSILVLTHSALDGPGVLESWASSNRYQLDLRRADTAPALPDPRDYAAMIVLGSVESVRNDAIPWIERERRIVTAALGHGVPVLGICFGGQLLAQSLGGHISACLPPEIGWQVIESDDPAVVPSGPWLLWHEERFTVPAGGSEVARTAGCPQAFVYGPHMGLQFHPEATADLLQSWVSEAHGRGALTDSERAALLAGGAGLPAPGSPGNAAHLFTMFASRAGLPGQRHPGAG
jgi:GMP synthase-like glutamine amidotransferase